MHWLSLSYHHLCFACCLRRSAAAMPIASRHIVAASLLRFENLIATRRATHIWQCQAKYMPPLSLLPYSASRSSPVNVSEAGYHAWPVACRRRDVSKTIFQLMAFYYIFSLRPRRIAATVKSLLYYDMHRRCLFASIIIVRYIERFISYKNDVKWHFDGERRAIS